MATLCLPLPLKPWARAKLYQLTYQIYGHLLSGTGFPGGSVVKKPLPMGETQVQSLGQEDHLEEEKGTHYSILAWRIPWTEEPGRLQSRGSQTVRHK